ncbi:HAD-IIA family hydrolase [Halobellus limi]|uniref:4-nitrophenyl phosphatase n=1 Tax=Halobellus limi TaxID=699433 RepID=A0A1H6AV53_9EURY|nr:HAD-IIA family hydrolase [Halobellus limi]QCC47762.1 HAD-IIA family hydrolase [Halobellus limi]SEG52120.1 4-nitrophenyl phosphatase [Halobellus limi]
MGVRGVIFDVDGTLVRGEEPIAGAGAGLDAVDATGLRRLLVSNNPTKPPEAYERRLRRAGFAVDPSEVITAGSVTARYLSENHPEDEIAVVGESGLIDLLRAAGLAVDPLGGDASPRAPDVLVASVDREFSYETLRRCLQVLEDRSVTFVGTDPDVVIPAADGDAPGSGAIIDAIANVAGRDPSVVLGKPSESAREMALERLGLPPEDVLVVGDRLDTDVAFGERAGMTTALVRTGIAGATDPGAPGIDPDYVLDSLEGLDSVLDDLATS